MDAPSEQSWGMSCPVLYGYLLRTYGPRHVRELSQSEAAQQQFALLSEVAARNDARLVIAGHDYARRVSGPQDIPGLLGALETARKTSHAQGRRYVVLMDDYSRLFRVMDPGVKVEMWQRLIGYADHLLDLRLRQPLDQLTVEMALAVKMGALPPIRKRERLPVRPEAVRRAQTAKAQIASRVVRSQAALQAARLLRDAFEKARSVTPGLTMKAFIASDAAQALKNSRGKRWSYRSALRALRGLDAQSQGSSPTPDPRG